MYILVITFSSYISMFSTDTVIIKSLSNKQCESMSHEFRRTLSSSEIKVTTQCIKTSFT